MKPCCMCPTVVMCRMKPLIKCPIIFNYYNKHEIGVSDLEKIAEYLKKSDWSFSERDGVIMYTPVEASKLGPALSDPNTPYKLSTGGVFYYTGTRSNYEIHNLKEE